MRFREVENIILKDGWYQVKQKGSHINTDTHPNLGKLQYQSMVGT